MEELFTPNVFELVFAESQTSQPASLVGLLLLLKTFQRLGYFVKVADVSSSIVHQVTRATGLREIPRGIATYDSSRTRRRHEAAVRSYLGVAAFDRQAKRAMLKACLEASRVREDLADIVNVAIEELVRQRYELPGFTTLFRGARSARATVNRGYYAQISASVDDATKGRFEWLYAFPLHTHFHVSTCHNLRCGLSARQIRSWRLPLIAHWVSPKPWRGPRMGQLSSLRGKNFLSVLRSSGIGAQSGTASKPSPLLLVHAALTYLCSMTYRRNE